MKKFKNSLKIIRFKYSCRFEHFFILANICIVKHFLFCYLNIIFQLCYFFITFFIFLWGLDIVFIQFVNRNLLNSFLFPSFANILFIVMTVCAKGLCYFLSFIVHLFLRRLPNFLKQWFSCCRGFPFASNNRFFHVFECGNHITFECFLPCPMDTFMSPEWK